LKHLYCSGSKEGKEQIKATEVIQYLLMGGNQRTYNLFDDRYEAIVLHEDICRSKGITPIDAATSPQAVYNQVMKIS